jgi:acetyl esterase/lipase
VIEGENEMASERSAELTALYQHWGRRMAAEPNMSLTEMRRMLDHWGDVTAEPREVDYEEVDDAGVRGMWATPKKGVHDRILLAAHGGGCSVCSIYSHRKLFGHIAKAVGCRVFIVDFPLAPENVHPAPRNGVLSAYQWLLGSRYLPNHIGFIGDSAGGGLAVTTAVEARDLGLPLPACIISLCPWIDMEASSPSFDKNGARDAFVSRPLVLAMAAMYLGEAGDRRDPGVNPVYGHLGDLPPIYIQVGEHEVLLDDSLSLAEAIRRDGGVVDLDIVPEMQHVFHFLAGTAPEADAAIEQLARWTRPKLQLAE